MKVLVTGANGFVGQCVVQEFLRRGHRVRALVRPATDLKKIGWGPDVEVFRSDLRVPKDLVAAFDGVELLVHLAAAVSGTDEVRFAATATGTEHILNAMALSGTKRLILASSFSVYDWGAVRWRLSEDSPLDARIYERDGYAIAKFWQERLVRRMSQEHGWELTVLRPGFVWGRGNDWLSGLGQRVGRFYLVFGPTRPLPLTHVKNCAHAFVTAAENPKAVGQTFNLVDGHRVSAWRYTGEYLKRGGEKGLRVPVPYFLAALAVRFAYLISYVLFKGKGKLPGLLVPRRFQARFKPLRFSNKKIADALGWKPPFDFKTCLASTYGAASHA